MLHSIACRLSHRGTSALLKKSSRLLINLNSTPLASLNFTSLPIFNNLYKTHLISCIRNSSVRSYSTKQSKAKPAPKIRTEPPRIQLPSEVLGQNRCQIEKSPRLTSGQQIHGYMVLSSHVQDMSGDIIYEFEHMQTGARHTHVASNSSKNSFFIGFRTFPSDDKGLGKMLLALLMMGSETYPATFYDLHSSTWKNPQELQQTGATGIGFETFFIQDYYNSLSTFLNCVFQPRPWTNIEFEACVKGVNVSMDGKISPNGIVLRNLMSQISHLPYFMDLQIRSKLFHRSSPRKFSNHGQLSEIVHSSSLNDVVDFFNSYIYASNSWTTTVGDIDIEKQLEFINQQVLSKLPRRSRDPINPSDKFSSFSQYERDFDLPASKSDSSGTGKMNSKYSIVEGPETPIAGKPSMIFVWPIPFNTPLKDQLILRALLRSICDMEIGTLKKLIIETDEPSTGNQSGDSDQPYVPYMNFSIETIFDSDYLGFAIHGATKPSVILEAVEAIFSRNINQVESSSQDQSYSQDHSIDHLLAGIGKSTLNELMKKEIFCSSNPMELAKELCTDCLRGVSSITFDGIVPLESAIMEMLDYIPTIVDEESQLRELEWTKNTIHDIFGMSNNRCLQMMIEPKPKEYAERHAEIVGNWLAEFKTQKLVDQDSVQLAMLRSQEATQFCKEQTDNAYVTYPLLEPNDVLATVQNHAMKKFSKIDSQSFAPISVSFTDSSSSPIQSHIHTYFDIHSMPLDLLPFIPLWIESFGKTGFLELSGERSTQIIHQFLPSFSQRVIHRKNPKLKSKSDPIMHGDFATGISIQASAFSNEIDVPLLVIGNSIRNQNFDDHELVKHMIERSRMSQGWSLLRTSEDAKLLAAAKLDPLYAHKNLIYGISTPHRRILLTKQSTNYNQKEVEMVVSKLKQINQFLSDPSNVKVAVNSYKAYWDQHRDPLQEFVSLFDNKNPGSPGKRNHEMEFNLDDLNKNSLAFFNGKKDIKDDVAQISSEDAYNSPKNQFVGIDGTRTFSFAKAFNTNVTESHPDYAPLLIVCQLLNRLMYAGDASPIRMELVNGIVFFSSFGEPEFEKMIESFDTNIKRIINGLFEQRELNRAKLDCAGFFPISIPQEYFNVERFFYNGYQYSDAIPDANVIRKQLLATDQVKVIEITKKYFADSLASSPGNPTDNGIKSSLVVIGRKNTSVGPEWIQSSL